jgi:hypothetical protein
MEFSAVSFELRSILDLFREPDLLSDFYPCYLCSLFQGSMTVTEYRDRFLQLARYAPADVAALPRVCFHCGEPGHYANVCPWKAQAG